MPFICLTNANIPDGTVQILDLTPNESQRNQSIDPPGQTRYVNRVENDGLALSPTGGAPYPVALRHLRNLQEPDNLKGLAAYLADVVDPGGTQQAVGTVRANTPLVNDTFTVQGVVFTAVENTALGSITARVAVAGVGALTLGGLPFNCVTRFATGTILVLVGATAGDIVTIAGVPFTAVNPGPANPAAQEFLDVAASGSDILTAASLATAINDPATQALLTAALDALVPVPTLGTLTGANGGTATVTLTPSVAGDWGTATLAEDTGGVNFTLSGPAMAYIALNPAAQEFGSAAHYQGQTNPDAETATSLEASINDAATQAAMDALNLGPLPALMGHMEGSIDPGTPTVVDLESSRIGVGGELTLVSAQPLSLIVSGATLVHQAPDATAQEFSSFLDAGTNIASAATMATTLNNAATDALLIAAGGSSVTAATNNGTTCTMTADTAGTIGSMTLASSNAGRLPISGTHLAKTMQTWTGPLLNAAAAALVARMDAGAAAMTAAGMNTAMNAVPGISGVSVTSVGSNSSVLDILSILAGRGYQVPVGTVKDTTGWSWSTTQAGSFTETVQVFGDVMTDGEWKTTTPFVKFGRTGRPSQQPTGGDADVREYKPIRYTLDGTSFAISVGQGQIQGFANGVTLYPDSSLTAFVPTWYQPGPKFPETANARVVVVYDDAGNIIV